MGGRSFLIKFSKSTELKCFYDWKNYIAHVVCESYDNDNHDLETKNAKEIIKKGLPLDSKKYNNRNFGDYQLNLVGFKFWAGGIWGLVSTDSVGEEVLELLMELILPKNYYTRMWNINSTETNYDETPVTLFNSSADYNTAYKILKNMQKEHEINLLNYENVLKSNNLPKDKFMHFSDEETYKAFNIEYKKKPEAKSKTKLFSGGLVAKKLNDDNESDSDLDSDLDSNSKKKILSSLFKATKKLADQTDETNESDSDNCTNSEKKPLNTCSKVIKSQDNSDSDSDSDLDNNKEPIEIVMKEKNPDSIYTKNYKIDGQNINLTFCYNKNNYLTKSDAIKKCISMLKINIVKKKI